MKHLSIAPGLAFPLDAVTQTFGILAVRGAGKSNTARALAEEMHAAGLPFVAIDPVGSWWGLRSAGPRLLAPGWRQRPDPRTAHRCVPEGDRPRRPGGRGRLRQPQFEGLHQCDRPVAHARVHRLPRARLGGGDVDPVPGGLAMKREETTNAVLVEVAVERARQEAKWGEQNHEPTRYLAILAEEFGEASQATVELTFDSVNAGFHRERLRLELIQTAAVAVAFVECLDRQVEMAPPRTIRVRIPIVISTDGLSYSVAVPSNPTTWVEVDVPIPEVPGAAADRQAMQADMERP